MAEDLIAKTLEKAYEHMDKDGFFPVAPCKVCGFPLSGKDGPRPAETYAGTFTGLCYSCERGQPYVVPGSELPDGARRVSHPPASPSWRRDRTEHWAYPDCEGCKGLGAKMRHTSMNQYLEFCRPCMARVMKTRKVNEIKFLHSVALQLEQYPLIVVHRRDDMTEAQATVSEACRKISKVVLTRWRSVPLVWQPQSYLLSEAESKLTKGQMNAKRADTLRRHLVTALRARAEEIASTSTS